MIEPEKKLEIQLIRHTIETMRHSMNLNLDTLLARLDNLTDQKPARGNGRRRVTDWKKEVESWGK